MNLLDHRFRSSKADGPDASQVQPSHWNDGHQFQGGNNGDVLVRDVTDPAFGATWASLGKWAAVPFNAGNFFCDSGGWAVASVAGQRYAVIGNVMRYHVYIPTSTVTGNPSILAISLPAGFGIAAELHDTPLIDNAGGGLALAQLFALPGDTHLSIAKFAGAWLPGATSIYVSTTIEIVGTGTVITG